jgi:hypothetical protein
VEFKVKNAEEDLELSRVDDGEGFNNTREDVLYLSDPNPPFCIWLWDGGDVILHTSLPLD